MTPKITVHGGPSVAGASVVGGSWSNEDEADIWPEPAKAEVSEEPSPQSDYEDWTVEQLKEQLADRGLAKSGKRDDLVQRLREDDDARATEPGAE